MSSNILYLYSLCSKEYFLSDYYHLSLRMTNKVSHHPPPPLPPPGQALFKVYRNILLLSQGCDWEVVYVLLGKILGKHKISINSHSTKSNEVYNCCNGHTQGQSEARCCEYNNKKETSNEIKRLKHLYLTRNTLLA